MRTQLVLIDQVGADWRLDDRTKELGRQGIAAARAALEQAGRNARVTEQRTPAA
ncbi:MAG TPA: hypothetical protein VGO92_00030 [Acidimicrobiales bacterium]|jgi:hypothetical protein|nr:hypothetical protein [Acidimicrobiales bacterium]